jgi:hypothetical protein
MFMLRQQTPWRHSNLLLAKYDVSLHRNKMHSEPIPDPRGHRSQRHEPVPCQLTKHLKLVNSSFIEVMQISPINSDDGFPTIIKSINVAEDQNNQ